MDQLQTMRRAGLLVRGTLDLIKSQIKAGITTSALDAIAEANIKRGGGTSNFKGYHGFPATICVSINDEIVHEFLVNEWLCQGMSFLLIVDAIIDGLAW